MSVSVAAQLLVALLAALGHGGAASALRNGVDGEERRQHRHDERQRKYEPRRIKLALCTPPTLVSHTTQNDGKPRAATLPGMVGPVTMSGTLHGKCDTRREKERSTDRIKTEKWRASVSDSNIQRTCAPRT